MAELHLYTKFTPWKPTPTQLPADWIALSDELAQQAQGSPRSYVLNVKFNARLVGEQLRSWGLPWDVVMAGFLWEYEEQQILSQNLRDADKVLNHIREANLYARYIEDENLPPLLTPPYRDLGALLIAVSTYYQALRALQKQSNEQAYTGPLDAQIENIGRTLLNVVKRQGLWTFKRDVEDLIEQLCNPQRFAEDQREHARILAEDAGALEDLRRLLIHKYHKTTQQEMMVVYTPCGIAGMNRRRQDAHTTTTSHKTRLTGFDLVTYDVIVPKVKQCYEALGFVSDLGYIQDRVTDHIAHPKPNGYSHIALGLILQPQDLNLKWSKSDPLVCQLQIATHLMQAIACFGCLHPRYYWLYTQPFEKKIEPISEEQLWQSEEGKIFLTIQEDLASHRTYPETEAPIIVYDKSRRSIALPKGATALDFAFKLDIATGERAVDAIVNNRKAPLYRALEAGDIIEIRTSREIQAQEYWKQYVTTSEARQQITESVNRRSLVQRGYSLLRQALEQYHYNLRPGDLDQELDSLLKKYNLGTQIAYLEQLDEANKAPYNPSWAAQAIIRQIAERNEQVLGGRPSRVPVLDMQLRTNKINLPRQLICGYCEPSYPNDMKIMGRLRKGGTELVVHREGCPRLNSRTANKQPEIFPMSWQQQPPAFRVTFFMTAQDRPGLILDITKLLRRHQCKFVHIDAGVTSKIQEACVRITIETGADKEVLDIWQELEKVKNVTRVVIDENLTPITIYEHMQKLYAQGTSLPVRTVIELTWQQALAALDRRQLILKNPYDISRPASPKMFFGRTEETKMMQRELCEGEHGKALILYGPRRSGKSSLCKNFLDSQVRPPYWHVLYSLQNDTGHSEEEILRRLADEIGREFHEQLQQSAPPWEQYNESDPQVRFKRFLQDCMVRVPGTRLVLALDEFGGAIDAYEKHFLDYRFFTYWKELMSEVSQLSLMLALPTHAHQMLNTEVFAHAFHFAGSLPMLYLDQESAERLLVAPLKEQQIAVHPNTVAYATKLTGRNPYYMTLIGWHLVNHLNEDPRKQQVLNEDIHHVVDQIIEMGANQNFNFYRQELLDDIEVRILEAMVELTTRLDQMAVQLKKIAAALNLPENYIRQYLERLRNGLILEENNPKANSRFSTNPSYSFKIDLLRIWLSRNHWFFSLSME